MTAGSNLEARLGAIVGEANVLTAPDLMSPFEVDWTRRFGGRARLVVRPATPEELATILTACNEERVPVVAQGGNTGLVGGGIPTTGEVLISLRRLDRLGPVDVLAGQVTVEAGATLGSVQRHAAASDLAVGVDLGARDSATIGGMVATNAGGIRVLRYGAMRSQLAGVEAVLADGSRVGSLSGLLKDNTGLHWPSILAGSEGTLAVVTRARLRLHPRWRHRVAALLAFESVSAALEAAIRLRTELPAVEALELMLEDGMSLVIEYRGGGWPINRAPAYLLTECADHLDPTERMAPVLADLPGLVDTAVGSDATDRRRLWELREGHTEVVSAVGVPHKLDVTLPLFRLAEFADRVVALNTSIEPRSHTYLWGHCGDGNLHVNVLGLEPDDERIDDAVLHLTAEMGGSISAEHGIGRAKRRWLHLTRSPSDIAAMRAVKKALDPNGILNPGVLLPDDP